MQRKAQVLIIFLWILTTLAILTVSLADRIALVLKYTQTRRDMLKASFLAYAGMNRGIAELKQDMKQNNPNYDGLTETWADNEDKFAKIQLTDNPEEYATIKNETGKFGMIDEDRKININKAPKNLLLALLEYYNIASAQEIVDNILIWRESLPYNSEDYESLGYLPKAKPFANIAELMLVKGIEEEDFKKIAKVITVYGDEKININTAAPEVIEIFCRYVAKQNNYVEEDVQPSAKNVADEFTVLRNDKLTFKDNSEIISNLSEAKEVTIFAELKNDTKLKSDHFLIEVTGNAGKIKTKVAAVYNRALKRFESWYEE